MKVYGVEGVDVAAGAGLLDAGIGAGAGVLGKMVVVAFP